MATRTDPIRFLWGRSDLVSFYESIYRPETIDRASFDEQLREVDAKLCAAVARATLPVMVVLTDEPALAVAHDLYIFLEPLADVVFAVSPSDIS